MSAVRCPLLLKIATFSLKDSARTLSICLPLRSLALAKTKLENIFDTIVQAYQSLWHFKDYGNTLEIITPVATVNNMFVSIFITKRGH